ncbi:MAG TPA: XylR N-terminal domain-containing protein [Bacillota bacterium]
MMRLDKQGEENVMYGDWDRDRNRNILVPMSAFGELRKDLMNNLGLNRMKGFLIRYGWELGKQDGKKIKRKNINEIEKMIHYGPLLHMKKGHVITETTCLDIDKSKEFPLLKMTGIWKSSYEAHEHKRLFGEANHGVCYTLIGYASGYMSELFGKTVIFKEQSCEGMGDPFCRWIGKPKERWGDELEDILIHFRETPIVQELEETYEKLLEERNNLARTAEIHKRLTEEIIRGNDLQSISNVVHETFGIPLLIEDSQFRTLAQSTFLQSKHQIIKTSFQSYLAEKSEFPKIKVGHTFRPFYQTKFIRFADHQRLITPIFLQGEIYGYCSLIDVSEEQKCPDIAHMVIERIASVCSLYLLNEKVKFETSERIKGNFLQQLINGQFISKKDMITRGNYIHLNLEKPYYIAVITYDGSYQSIEEELTFHDALLEQISLYFKNRQINVLTGQRSNDIILFISIEVLGNQLIEHFFQKIVTYLQDLFPSRSFTAGISLKDNDIEHIRDLFDQALAAVRLTTSKNKIVTFQSLGIVGSLINPQNKKIVEKSAKQILDPIISMCDGKREESLKTLYFFLENGGNLEETADDLALSVSGLRYRIRKIEEIIGKDLRNPADNYQLLLSLQALILIGKLEINERVANRLT